MIPDVLSQKSANNKGIILTDGTLTSLITAGSNGLKIQSIAVANEDNVINPALIQIWFNNGTTDFLLGTAPVPFKSGTDGSPSYNIINDIDLPFVETDAFGNRFIRLKNTESIKIKVTTAIAPGKNIYVTAFSCPFK